MSCVAAPAQAAVTLQTYAFTAATGGPYTTHAGTFDLNYDDVADSYALVALDYRLGPSQFTRLNTSLLRYGPVLVLSGFAFGYDGFTPVSARFILDFIPGRSGNLEYNLDPNGLSLNAVRGSVNIVTRTPDPGPDPVAVPEPATWGLLFLGFALAGGLIRRRRAVTAAA